MKSSLPSRALALVCLAAALAGCQQTPVVNADDGGEEGRHFVAVYDAETLADADTSASWPKDWRLTIDLTLAQPKTGKYRRPYVAVWIEDAGGKPVRFLTLWGKSVKYKQDLRDFWPNYRQFDKPIDSVTGPTRPPGEHQLLMDGLDLAGKPLPPGDYTVHVEVVREHGTRVHMKKAITCKTQAVTEKLPGNLEVDGVTITFGPPAK
jgi:hypothetical protein